MVEKKLIKKVKKSTKDENDGQVEAKKEKATAPVNGVRPKAPQPQGDDYDAMKKRYLDLKKRYEELEKAFNRIGTLEQDVKKVHQKLDNMDANSANVQKDLAVVKSRVAGIQKDMKAIAVVASNISRAYGFDIKVSVPPDKPQALPKGQAPQKPQRSMQPVQRPVQPQAAQKPVPPAISKAAKALVMARTAEQTTQRPVSDEITADPAGKGRPVGPKDHKDATDRMDDVIVEGDDDMDTVDYLVRPEGRKVPLSKDKVEEELKEPKTDK